MSASSREPGPIRSDSIYVSWVARKALSYVRGQHETSDELADRILMEWLTEHHPKVLDHIHAQTNEDREFRKKYEAPK